MIKNERKKEPTQKEQGFYHTPIWRRIRVIALRRDHYLCQWCLKDKKIVRAREVHHVRALEDYPDKALDVDNLVSLCHDCHETTKDKKPESEYKARVIKI